jgi:hypothetical protein
MSAVGTSGPPNESSVSKLQALDDTKSDNVKTVNKNFPSFIVDPFKRDF